MLNTKNMFNMIISDTERSSTYLFYFVLFFCEELRKRIRATGEKSGHVLFFDKMVLVCESWKNFFCRVRE